MAKCANTDKDVQEDCQKRLLATGTSRDKGTVQDWPLGSTGYSDTPAPNPGLHRLLQRAQLHGAESRELWVTACPDLEDKAKL